MFIAKGTKFHKAIGPSAAYCNSRSGIAMSPAHPANIARASATNFCSKCFSAEKALAAIALAAYFTNPQRG